VSIDAQFQLSNPAGIKQIDVDFGSGSIGFSTANDPEFVLGRTEVTTTLSYAAAGVFLPIIYVTDMQGNTSQHPFALSVVDPTSMNQMVQDLWARMTGKVRKGDIAGALTAFVQAHRDKFGSAFQNLQPDPATAINQLGSFSGLTVSPDDAEYQLIRQNGGTADAYPVHLMRDADGVWRIDEM
jgi:hypothetical protein